LCITFVEHLGDASVGKDEKSYKFSSFYTRIGGEGGIRTRVRLLT
jgi:hypothetical protein